MILTYISTFLYIKKLASPGHVYSLGYDQAILKLVWNTFLTPN